MYVHVDIYILCFITCTYAVHGLCMWGPQQGDYGWMELDHMHTIPHRWFQKYVF